MMMDVDRRALPIAGDELPMMDRDDFIKPIAVAGSLRTVVKILSKKGFISTYALLSVF